MQQIKVGDLVKIKSIPGLYKDGMWLTDFSESMYGEDISKHYEVVEADSVGCIRLAGLRLYFGQKDLEIVNG